MEQIVLILSLVLNVILGIITFFKTSLNEVITEWGKSWIKQRKQKKETLIRIHSLVKKLDKIAFILLIKLAIFETNPGQDNEDRKEYLKKWGELNDEIEENELLLPIAARNEYRNLRDIVQRFGGEISREGTSKERLDKMGAEIEIINSKLLKEIEKAI